MRIESAYYNHYNVKGRYTPDKPKATAWKEQYTSTEDKIKSKNYNQDSDQFKAYTRLEEVYYSLGVSNRAKYKTEGEVYAALNQKYRGSGNYKNYSYNEVEAMYDNELEMTLYGCLAGGGNPQDPHLKGEVKDPSDNEQQLYNQHMVNTQLGNIFSSNGLSNLLGQYNMIFTIDPFNNILKVLGVDDVELTNKIEEILNADNNSKELFYHIMNSSSGSISDDVKLKYRALSSFKNVTGQDLRGYKQTESGMVNEKGENVLDVYREALKESTAIPTEYKGDAYNYFAEQIEELLAKDFFSIPDLNLSIGYKDGLLYDLANENLMESRFNFSV
ncbi:MAG TPA: DUF4885 family protein [Epulopiscium sp.]|nr:DUF4885 family protein [Candidatus Epulonipiscium sp.]